MQIVSLKVKDFGCLSGEMSVSFGPGLNVVHGPNEIGKSTLLRAIEYALTVKADVTGSTREKIAPRAGGVPTVNLSFTQGGCRCELEKVYKGQGGRATLRVTEPNGKTALLNDDDADARLRDMLGVQETKRQRKNEDHLGIWPLLWIRQGESGLAPSERLNDLGKQDLGARLSELSGEVLAGADSEQVLAKVKEEYACFFTDSGAEVRKADAPLQVARQRQSMGADEVSSLERLLEVHGQSMDRLSGVQSELATLREQLPKLKRRRDEVRAFAERARSVQSAVQVLEADVRGLDADAKRLSRLVDERKDLCGTISVLRDQLEATEIERVDAEKRAQQHAGRLPNILERLNASQQAVKAVRRASDRLQSHIESMRARKELERITTQLEQATKVKLALRDGEAELASLRVNSKSLKKLRAAALQVRDQQIALEIVAATVTIVAGSAVTARVGGESVPLETGGSVRRSIVELTSIELGVHTITVMPGGTELTDLRDRLATAQEKLNELLAAAAVPSVQEAETQLERRVKLEASVENLTERLGQLAPEGVDALEADVARLALAVQQHETHRDECAQPGEIVLPETLDLSLAEAARRAAAADEAQTTLDAAQAEKAAFDRDATQLFASAKQLCDQAAEQKTRLADNTLKLRSAVAADGDDAALTALQSGIEKSITAKQAQIREQQQLFDGRTVLDVEEEYARSELAVTNSEEEMKRKEVEQEGLRARLTSAEVLGLEERLDKARAERDRASADVARLERRAKAASLLYNTLVACRDAARSRYLAPLEQEVQALLPLLMRGAVASFDETFAVTSLSRQASGEDSFETLSGGCQEQLGVLIRLAIASVLAQDDEPLVVMLDDALVSSDEERYRRMGLVFTRCARKLQIIMATCHWERYRELGVAAAQAHDLRQLRAGAEPLENAVLKVLTSREATAMPISP